MIAFLLFLCRQDKITKFFTIVWSTEMQIPQIPLLSMIWCFESEHQIAESDADVVSSRTVTTLEFDYLYVLH